MPLCGERCFLAVSVGLTVKRDRGGADMSAGIGAVVKFVFFFDRTGRDKGVFA